MKKKDYKNMSVNNELAALLVNANENSLSAWQMTNEILEEKVRIKSELLTETDICVLRLAQKKVEFASCALIKILENVKNP